MEPGPSLNPTMAPHLPCQSLFTYLFIYLFIYFYYYFFVISLKTDFDLILSCLTRGGVRGGPITDHVNTFKALTNHVT
jgi:hypothetical protein